ncbi:hypothetical protein [Marivita sp. GX14005]|uniref:hypothetical protein n=1 Tax=Marivita sp. GX14005 TaxID=2942276 RepID=UPI0020191146|nr:hypothetical protein [Marivita sp. GX14005]MCL3882381.1 hypothetical protein [Marivita sp. GX14005]
MTSSAGARNMTNGIDKLAWIGTALAILAWAFAPHLVNAEQVALPLASPVTTTLLPPAGSAAPGSAPAPAFAPP